MVVQNNLTNNTVNTISMLKTVNMYHAAEALNEIIEKSIENALTCEKFLEEILLKEIQGREKRKLEKRLKPASLSTKHWSSLILKSRHQSVNGSSIS
jgi:hypothetical protein